MRVASEHASGAKYRSIVILLCGPSGFSNFCTIVNKNRRSNISMQSSTKKDSRPRGRPRTYDPQEALARARDTFWRNGYAGTSLDDLSEATGMNRPSLYGAFGDKHALYLQTMERYVEAGRAAMESALDSALPLREALMRVFD